MTLRWINGWEASDTDWDRIAQIIDTRGWMPLNKKTTRILVAEDSGTLLGFYVLQMMPHAEPLFVAPSQRGTGLADLLVNEMRKFLEDSKARGCIIVADSPHVQLMCEAAGMQRIDSPVYMTPLGVLEEKV